MTTPLPEVRRAVATSSLSSLGWGSGGDVDSLPQLRERRAPHGAAVAEGAAELITSSIALAVSAAWGARIIEMWSPETS